MYSLTNMSTGQFLLRSFVNFAALHFFTKALHKKLRGYMGVSLIMSIFGGCDGRKSNHYLGI